jgi:hypothetical protein
MNARFASQDEIDIWDSLTALNPNGGNIFQVKAFAQIKGNHHWTPRFILVENIYISVLERTVSPIGKFWYSPKGPGIYNVQVVTIYNESFSSPLNQSYPGIQNYSNTIIYTIM